MEYIIKHPDEYRSLGSLIQEKEGGIVLLEGDLGTGKTTFTKVFSTLLGEETIVTSPTFSIIKEYPAVDLIHMDLYRIMDTEELLNIGFEEYLDHKWVLIEWPEVALPLLPKEVIRVSFEVIDDSTRKVRIDDLSL